MGAPVAALILYVFNYNNCKLLIVAQRHDPTDLWLIVNINCQQRASFTGYCSRISNRQKPILSPLKYSSTLTFTLTVLCHEASLEMETHSAVATMTHCWDESTNQVPAMW